jgi:CRISP-associated protein Cas1
LLGRIVEIADDKRYLFVHRGFLVVQETSGDRRELGQVPLDDITALIANAHGIVYSNNLLVALAERGVPFVLCADNHNAVGMIWPIDGNYQQAKRFDAQLSASLPLKKRLWAEIVKSKIQQQAASLEACGANPIPVQALIKRVKSGDSSNVEAHAARRYWSLLFGAEFARDQAGSGLNALLNYGYTVLRSATARAVVAAGLHPTMGLHHSNAGNPMRLVDDLMEPFRPLIDCKVYQLHLRGETEVLPGAKRALVKVLYEDMSTSFGTTPLLICIQRTATSLAQVFLKERTDLELPFPATAISLAASFNNEQ